MKIRFWGTGAAEGVPAEFCGCEYCLKIRAMGQSEWRTRSQVVIDDELSIDYPPEAYSHSLKYGVILSQLKYLLVTHSHMDHFYAHDFILRGYKYAAVEGRLEIYGNEEVEKVFSECTAREMKPAVAANLDFIRVSSYNRYRLGAGDGYNVLTIPANHGTLEDAVLYYIEKNGRGYLHLYDTGRLKEEAYGFLKSNGAKAAAVAFDCTFGSNTAGENSRHMGIGDVEYVRSRLKDCGVIDDKTICIITHFSHNCNPTRENLQKLEEEYGVKAAFDGFEVEI